MNHILLEYDNETAHIKDPVVASRKYSVKISEEQSTHQHNKASKYPGQIYLAFEDCPM